MEILPASLLDLNALRKLEHLCFDKDAWSLLDLIAVLSWPDVFRIKAVDDSQMIGFAAGETRRSHGEAWIATLAVDPRFQRRGIGRALLRRCESQIQARRMKLTVRVSNLGAISLYEREGYRTTDIWRGYYKDGEDGLVMEKSL
ncbi:MAG: GNAT family N-acetyltransferase [Anaerolineales bacterium]|nr:MAG: GNAT family N-acetyltransferase [Anaerolineales bacterium]